MHNGAWMKQQTVLKWQLKLWQTSHIIYHLYHTWIAEMELNSNVQCYFDLFYGQFLDNFLVKNSSVFFELSGPKSRGTMIFLLIWDFGPFQKSCRLSILVAGTPPYKCTFVRCFERYHHHKRSPKNGHFSRTENAITKHNVSSGYYRASIIVLSAQFIYESTMQPNRWIFLEYQVKVGLEKIKTQMTRNLFYFGSVFIFSWTHREDGLLMHFTS